MKRRKHSDTRSIGNRVWANMCAVETCHHAAVSKHHYVPHRMIPGNSFSLQLCEDHHKMADELIANIGETTPLKLFQIMFDFIYGKGAAYRKIGKDDKKESTHYWNPDVDYAGSD